MDYDEEMVKRMLGKCPDEDMARKTLNALVRTTTIPVEKVMNLIDKVKLAMDESVKVYTNLMPDVEPEHIDMMKKLVVNSFVMSLIGNMMICWNISEEDMKDMMRQVYDQTRNISKQQNQKV